MPIKNTDPKTVSVQVTKAYRESDSTALLNYGTKWKWSVPRTGGFTSDERGPGTHRIGRMSRRTSMEVYKTEMAYSCTQSNHISSVVQPTALSQHGLSYPGSPRGRQHTILQMIRPVVQQIMKQ